MHAPFSDHGRSGRLGDIHIPARCESELRAALVGPDGGETYLAAQDRKFTLHNRVERAAQDAVANAEHVRNLERDVRAVERKLGWVSASFKVPRRTRALNWGALAPAFGLAAVGLIGMIVSTSILMEYVLKSASELFAGNAVGAALFATLPSSLGAVAFKVFEQRLLSARARWWYAAVIFGGGALSLGVWVAATAIHFAPNTGGIAAALVSERSDNGTGVILLLATVICDLSFGYTALAGVGYLLAARHESQAVPNPEYLALTREKRRLKRAIGACRRRQDAAEEYLSLAAAGRELTRNQAEADLACARELWAQEQKSAVANFLSERRGNAMMHVLAVVFTILVATLSTPALAKTRIIVLAPEATNSKDALLKQIAETVAALMPGDQLLVYGARPITQIAGISRPSNSEMNQARLNAALGAQFKPVKDFLTAPATTTRPEPPGNLMLPSLFDELGRNLLASLSDKGADILLVGSLLHVDPRDGRSAMTDRYVPSDGTFRAARADWPFSVVGSEARLRNMTLLFCSPNAATEYESAEHEERVRRFWSLWITGQSGRIGTFSHDLTTCFRRFRAGEASGQTGYQLGRDSKAEMIRVPLNEPPTLPASFQNPGQYFLREDMPISRTPPAVSKGIAWVGLRWNAPCDVDLYARGDVSNKWLYFGSVRTADGFFNKDFVAGTGNSMEYVEFTREIDLDKAEVAINLYACELASPPEGVIRVWFAGNVYQAPFKLAAKSGNKGAMPIAGPHWLRVDLRKVVGLVRD